MQSLDRILSILQERGRQGKTIERVYRHLLRDDLLLHCYNAIGKNQGALTPGTTPETVDGMSMARIEKIKRQLATGKWNWTPVRRVHIPKAQGGIRPLGLPSWPDKMVQQAVKTILEPYYEPQFHPDSFGFRPHRGCHDALAHIKAQWTGTVWFIEGDIQGCFDNLSHEVILAILRRNIEDRKFLRLIEGMLQAGYLEAWKHHRTESGAPQGGIASPLLANIVLNELDWFVERVLAPRYNRGDKRKINPEYVQIQRKERWAKQQGNLKDAKEWRRLKQSLPSMDCHDPDFRRLRYVRYADDFILGFIGPKQEALDIKQEIGGFLNDKLNLKLSDKKTLITHARTERARFLGYEIQVIHNDRKRTHGRRKANGKIALETPRDAIEAKCRRYLKDGKPIHRPELTMHSDFHIVAHYGVVFRGIYEYYSMALNVSRSLNKLQWAMRESLLKTLAAKHKCSMSQVIKKFVVHGRLRTIAIKIETPKGKRIAIFGGFRLQRKPVGNNRDLSSSSFYYSTPSDMITRMLADKCELCGGKGPLQNHHVRKLKDVQGVKAKDRPQWMKSMIALRRKTLAVCEKCHREIHAGQYDGKRPS